MKMLKTIFFLMILSSPVMAIGVEYHYPGTSPFDSLESSTVTSGLHRQAEKIGMTNSGDVIVIPLSRTVTTVGTLALKSADWGANWSYDRKILGVAGTIGYSNGATSIRCYGDSCYILSGPNSGNIPPRLGKYVGIIAGIGITAGSLYDTLPISPGTNSRPTASFKMHGSKLLILNGRESGTVDTNYALLSAGELDDTTTWSQVGKFTRNPTALCKPMEWLGGSKGGIGMLEQAFRDFLWYDTVGGFDTLDANIIPYSDGGFQSFSWTPVKDSFGLVAYQKALGDSLLLKYFKVSGTGGGSGVALGIDTVGISGGLHIPAGGAAMPAISIVKEINGTITDTGYIFFRNWPDTSRRDSSQIVYIRFVLGVSSITLDTLCVLKPAKGRGGATASVDTCFLNLQSPSYIYNSNDSHNIALAYTDSLGAGVDLQKLYIYLARVFVGSTSLAALTSVAVDSIHNDFSEENDSASIVWSASADQDADSIIICYSDTGYVDSSDASRTAVVYVASATDSIRTVTNQAEPYTLYASIWKRKATVFSTRQEAHKDYITVSVNVLSWIDSTGASVKIRNGYTGGMDSGVYWYGLTNIFTGAIRAVKSVHATPDTVDIANLGRSTIYWIWSRLYHATMEDSDSLEVKTTAGSATGKGNIMPDFMIKEQEKWLKY